MNKGEKRPLRDKRGVSPVVATVILVAVTIIVAVAVAYWMGGIAGLYTRFEKMEITTAFATWNSTSNKWTVSLTFKNTGSADATVIGLIVNGKPYTQYNNASVTVIEILSPTDFATKGLPIPSGREGMITFTVLKTALSTGAAFDHGINIEVKLHSAAGQDYPKTLTLD